MTKQSSFINNRALVERARRVTPVASQTYSKSYRYFCGDNVSYFLDHGKGAFVWDVDGNRFTDFILALGPVTLGYTHDEVDDAIRTQLAKGISFSQSTELEVRLAEKLVEVVPCAEKVRFVKNGSDATAAAVRLARAFTGRDIILCSGYHGMQDWYIGSTPLNKGIPKSVCEQTVSFAYGNLVEVEALLEAHSANVACIILEAAQGTNSNADFLIGLKALCKKHGALLIFDEVITGFRLGISGAQGYFGITPDLAAIGKGMANGMPLSAVVGRADVMDLIEKGIFVSSTFGGEALSLAAALKTIEVLERPATFEHIWKLANLWVDSAKALLSELELNAQVSFIGLGPHSGFDFSSSGGLSSNDALSLYLDQLHRDGFLSIGVNNFCLAHREEDVQGLIRSTRAGLERVKRGYESGQLDPALAGKTINPIFDRN